MEDLLLGKRYRDDRGTCVSGNSNSVPQIEEWNMSSQKEYLNRLTKKKSKKFVVRSVLSLVEV